MAKKRAFIVEHSGRYLGGCSIAFAETRDEAKKMVFALLETAKIEQTIFDVKELPSLTGATMIWDGDY
jgi:hypothetical protein